MLMWLRFSLFDKFAICEHSLIALAMNDSDTVNRMIGIALSGNYNDKY